MAHQTGRQDHLAFIPARPFYRDRDPIGFHYFHPFVPIWAVDASYLYDISRHLRDCTAFSQRPWAISNAHDTRLPLPWTHYGLPMVTWLVWDRVCRDKEEREARKAAAGQ
jgi:hypothetical protein